MLKNNRQEYFLTIILVLIALIVVGLGFYYLTFFRAGVKKPTKTTKEKVISIVPSIVVSVKSDLPQIRKDEDTGKEIIEIPFNYEVRSISDREIILGKPGGDKDAIISYPSEIFSKIKVFLNKKEGTASGSLSDIKTNHLIKVFNINRGEEIRFYILNP